ncbi:MAG TPA: hypothetical protein EYP49_16865 [Anaerolineae bacterium]|nr:hypothetical protein [Anaerolineae bacterium]
MPERRFAILRADLGREIDNLRRLVAEAEEWSPRLSEWPRTVRTRTAGGILHDLVAPGRADHCPGSGWCDPIAVGS